MFFTSLEGVLCLTAQWGNLESSFRDGLVDCIDALRFAVVLNQASVLQLGKVVVMQVDHYRFSSLVYRAFVVCAFDD